MEHCFTCGNKGFPDKICPECGREPTRSSLNLDRHPNVENFIRKTSWSMIPAKYQGIFWNTQRSCPNTMNLAMMISYLLNTWISLRR